MSQTFGRGFLDSGCQSTIYAMPICDKQLTMKLTDHCLERLGC